MTWLAVHPDNTIKERVPDVDGAATFVFGFWPPREAERIKAALLKIQEASVEEDFDLSWDMVRFGIRGWEGLGEIAPVIEKVKVYGHEHPVLSEESMRVLHANHLVGDLSLKALAFNTLSEELKKKFKLRLPSLSPATSAPSAPPVETSPLPTGSITGSTGESSRGAPIA